MLISPMRKTRVNTHTKNSMVNHTNLLALLVFWLCPSFEHSVSKMDLFLKHGRFQIIWPNILIVNSVRTIKNLFIAICFQNQKNCLFQICPSVQTTVNQAFYFHIMEWYSCASDENNILLTGQMYFVLWQICFWHSSLSKSGFGQENNTSVYISTILSSSYHTQFFIFWKLNT